MTPYIIDEYKMISIAEAEVSSRNNSKMVFVVGNSRSGTTIMARVLARNPVVHTFHEIHFFEQLWNPRAELETVGISDAAELMSKLINIEREDYYGTKNIEKFKTEAVHAIESMHSLEMTPPSVYGHFITYETQRLGKSVACEQTPRNVFYIGEILRFFPNAVIVNMVRDPRPILLSQKRKWRIRSQGAKNWPIFEVLRSWVNYHPITTSLLWNSSIRAECNFEGHPRVRTIIFEEFVAEPDKVIKELCDFIGIAFEDEMLDIPHNEGGTSSLLRTDVQQGKGIDRAAASRWVKGGLNSGEILLCQLICAKHMKKFGFKLVKLPILQSAIVAFYYVLAWPIQITLALLLNIRRHSNLLGSIQRRLLSGR